MGYFVIVFFLLLMLLGCLFIPRRHAAARIGGVATCAGLVAVFTFFASYTVIPPATVGVKVTFGRVSDEPMLPGPAFVAPWASVVSLEAAQLIVEIKTDPKEPNSSIAMTRDEIPLTTLDVGLPFQLNPALAPRVYAILRDRYAATVLAPAAHSAVREAATRLSWREATTEKREEFRAVMREEFAKQVQAALVSNGLTEAEAKVAFVFPAVQLRAVLPPQRILSANAERQAATVDLERQTVLTQIAEQQAQRRTQEGNGIKNLFEQLPTGYSADDVYKVLTAVSIKEQADALSRAVEENRITMMVMPYNAAVPAVPHQAPPAPR